MYNNYGYPAAVFCPAGATATGTAYRAADFTVFWAWYDYRLVGTTATLDGAFMYRVYLWGWEDWE